ncbi:4-amino-4-deoxy-L-arabinose-phosphoundecaprenol flippase subunit ArnE [uncultured archaeon]|nr:4-amino-4-deoxy-L-arabinose-phosphoundecaprenol flippase subunit ArnE [uncultured archaeon]
MADAGKTSVAAMLLVVACTLFTTTGQLMIKAGMNRFSLTVPGTILNLPLVGGQLIYAFSAILLVAALGRGELSVLYPIFATGYVWVTLLSTVFLGESFGILRWAGVGFVLIGVSLLGRGQK